MRSRSATLGVLFATTTAVVWGGQFVVGKSALESVNAFPLSTMRYALAAALWLVVLAVLEGPAALRLDGRGWRLFWLGSLGFAGFNLLAYTGLAHARPETASLIVALGPLLTALVLWRRTGRRPPARRSPCSGSRCSESRSSSAAATPARSCTGRSAGARRSCSRACSASCSTASAPPSSPSFSPLRYTALTAALGWLTIAGATAVATATGLVELPVRPPARVRHAADPVPRDPRRLRRRPDLERGDRLDRPAERSPVRQPHPGHDLRDRDRAWLPPDAASSLGAALTVGALVANNLLARRSQTRLAREAPPREGGAPQAA